jgi:hypothetical protein
MALTGTPGRFAPVTRRVSFARFALIALSAWPAWLLGRGSLATGPATNPYFAPGDGPLPWIAVLQLVRQIAGPWAAGLALGLAVALLLDQLLLAGAVRVLAPPRGPWDRPRLAPAVFRSGLQHLWPLLRAALLAFALGGAGAAALRGLASWLQSSGTRSGWALYSIRVVIPAAALLAALCWIALVAAWALWTRVIVVVDGRRRARRAAVVALAVFRRHPVRALLGPAATLLLAAVAPLPVLAWWRAAEPLGRAGVAFFTLLALAALLLQAWLWTRLVTALVARYARPELDAVRFAPDAPFGLFAWIRTAGRRKGARRGELPAGP